MLADPGLVVIELIHPLHQFEITLERQSWVFVDWVKGRDKSAEAQSGTCHWISFFGAKWIGPIPRGAVGVCTKLVSACLPVKDTARVATLIGARASIDMILTSLI